MTKKLKAYPEYKSTSIDWLGDIPSHWRVVAGKWIVNFTYGFPADSKLFSIEKKGLPLIRIRDIYSTDTEVYYEGNDYPAESIINNGDLLIGMDGDFNVARWNGSKAVLNQRVCKYEDSEAISKKYMFYILPLILNEINATKYATTVKHLSATDLSEMKLTVPPIEEQEVIAAYLDNVTGKVDALIAEKQKQVEDLRAYRTSLVTETVTRGLDSNAHLRPSGIDWLGDIPQHWEISALKYLTSKIGSGVTPRGGSEVYLDKGVLFIRSQNVYPDGLHLDDPKYISESIDESMPNTRVYTGDILLNITGASIGRCCVYTKTESANVNQHVCIIRPLCNLIKSQFLCYILNSKIGQNQIALYQTGGNREGLNFEQLRNFAIPLPPLFEQQAIANFLDEKTAKIDALIDALTKQLDELAEYKKAVISEAVTGKVDVRDWKPNN